VAGGKIIFLEENKMFNKVSLFTIFSLLAAMMLVVACGAQPEPATSPAAAVDSAADDGHETTDTPAGEEEHHEEDAAHTEGEAHDEAAHDHEDEAAHADGEAHDEEAEAHNEDHDHEEAAHSEEHEHDEDHSQAEALNLKAVELAQGEKLKVVASTSIIADWVRNVAGDQVELTPLIPIGADLHTFTPTPQDLMAVADAHLVLINGLGAEQGLIESLENAGGTAVILPVSQGIELREMGQEEGHEHEGEEHHEEGETDQHEDEDEGADEHGHHHEGGDPHVWTTPHNAVTMVHNIEAALAALDPANAAVYQSQAEAYIDQLETLDTWVQAQIDTIPAENRELVTDHTAFGYYADRYGLTQVGAVIPSFSTAAEPSASEIAALQDAIIQYDVPAIFVGTTVNPSLSEQIAQDTGKQLLKIYTGSLGTAGSGVETYIEYIEYNTNAFVEGLK
jgi:manganese/iron transport system substrate-binding protein